MLRTALCSFFSGAAIAGGAGYYQIHQDTYTTAKVINEQISGIREEVVSNNKDLERRIAVLESIVTASSSAPAATIDAVSPAAEGEPKK